MGKRKQNSNTPVETGQLDAAENEKSSEPQRINCQHVAKAVDVNHIKKPLKSENLNSLSCTICSKLGDTLSKEENWLCLQCGARQCSQEHLKKHFEVTRSDLHALAFSISNSTIWCDICNSEIPEEDNKKLKSCVDFIKQTMERTKQVQIVETPYNDDIPPPLVECSESNDADCAKSNITNKRNNNCYQRPSVRGLVNLGNTCFFNSVLQCLARTPNLVETLQRLESEKEHISITLKDGHRLEGALERSNDYLGQCLADTLVALCRPGDTSTENPLKLLQLLRKKCPQFEGYDQHDSHELLRHLLDNVRQNDLKRYRSLMLNELGLSRKVNPQDVSPELQKKVKALDNEVVERVTLVPEHVFKGLLVSTLECQDCRNTSHCVESFLDLSLPIVGDKPQPPSIIRRKGSTSPELVDEKAGGGMSKYQMKKQARQVKRNARNNKHGPKSAVIAAADGSLPASVNSHSDKGESEADVEDNEEDKPHESGYSSEKIQSESSSLSGGDDSARTSPTTHVKDEHVQNNSQISVCEGLPAVGGCGGPEPTNLIPHSQYSPFSRVRRRPPSKWIGVGGSLTPSWLPHNDPICIPDPIQILEGGESWKRFAPREGVSPVSGKSKKDSRLNPIQEESDRLKVSESTKCQESSVSDQMSLMNRVVETMLAQVHISQEDLNRFENKSVTTMEEKRTECGEGDTADVCQKSSPVQEMNDCSSNCSMTQCISNRIPKYNPFNTGDNQENSPTNDMKDLNSHDLSPHSQSNDCIKKKISDLYDIGNETHPVTNEEATGNVETSNRSRHQEEDSPDSVTDETSNGFPTNTHYNRDQMALVTKKPDADENSLNYQCCNKTDNAMDEKGSLDISSIYQSYFQRRSRINNETEKKEDLDISKLCLSMLENEESVDVSPILSTAAKGDESRINEKKEECENQGGKMAKAAYRRRMLDNKETMFRDGMDSECSVQSCLTQFTAVEIMSGANRVGCTTCTQRHNKGNKESKTVYTIASKQLLIKAAPQVLILHLKRFQVQMYSFRKLSKHVSFSLYLDIAPFCLKEVERDEDNRIMYSLYGVVEHSGNLNGGHYVAYIKVGDAENNCRWFCISDSYVHEVTENRVLQSQAYLLFYRRINVHPSSS